MSQNESDESKRPWGLIILILFFVFALIGPIVWQALGI